MLDMTYHYEIGSLATLKCSLVGFIVAIFYSFLEKLQTFTQKQANPIQLFTPNQFFTFFIHQTRYSESFLHHQQIQYFLSVSDVIIS